MCYFTFSCVGGARHSRSSLEAAAVWGQKFDADGNCEPIDKTAKEQEVLGAFITFTPGSSIMADQVYLVAW